MKKLIDFVRAVTATCLAILVITGCRTENERQPDKGLIPTVALTAGDATEKSISFSAECSHADEAAWIVFQSGQPAPTAEDILMNGTRLDITAVSHGKADNLEADTEYTVYAAAAKGDVTGEVSLLTMKTLGTSEAEYDIRMEAKAARVLYTSGNSETDDYTLTLSSVGFTEKGEPMPESTYYSFYLAGTASADPDNPELPEGTYSYSSTGLAGTFSYGVCADIDSDGNTVAESPAFMREGSTVTVSRNGDGYYIEAVIYTESLSAGNQLHHVTYDGPVSMAVNSTGGDPGQPTVGVLEEDLRDIVFTDVTAFNYGEVDGSLCNNIILEFTNMELTSDGLYDYPGQVLYLDMAAWYSYGEIYDGSYPIGNSGDFGWVYPGSWQGGMSLPEGSYAIDIDEGGSFHIGAFSSGALTIEYDYISTYTFRFNFVTPEGRAVTGVYEGPVDVYDGTATQTFSTLTSDYEIPFGTTVIACASYYGDYNGTGNGNWILSLQSINDDGSSECFYADISGEGLDFNAGLQPGTYSASVTLEQYTFMPGVVDGIFEEGNYTYWCRRDASGMMTALSPAVDGTITISRDGDTYTVVIDYTDDAGYNVTGTWTGSIVLNNLGY